MASLYRMILFIFFAGIACADAGLVGPGYEDTIIEHRSTSETSIFPQNIFIPWTSPFSRLPTYFPSIRGSVSGRNFTFPVDTSSTGVLIGAPLLPDLKLTSQYQEGWEYLSYSKTLFSGRFVDFNVTFKETDKGKFAISRVPVLVVTKAVKCPGYDLVKDNGECPDSKIDKLWRQDLSTVVNMGVGFGRSGPGSGSPYGTPSHNPFINVIDFTDYKRSFMMAGYTITTRGVNLGSLGIETERGVFMDLEKLADPHPKAWAAPLVSWKYDSSKEVVQSKILVDTMITEMYIQSSPSVPLPNITTLNTDLVPQLVRRVMPGTRLSFAFPDFNKSIAGYNIVVGDVKYPAQPSFVAPVTDGTRPFVSTGRNFLYEFSIHFNAIYGRFGLVCENCSANK